MEVRGKCVRLSIWGRLDEYELGSVPLFDAFSGYSLAAFMGDVHSTKAIERFE